MTHDLIYFGDDPDSEKMQQQFMEEIKSDFPSVKLVDAYDSIKGYRQEVIFDDETTDDDLYMWLIANGWFKLSLSLQVIFMDNTLKAERATLIAKTRDKYPEAFKA